MNKILKKLQALQQHVYAPYSHYPVTAVVIGDNDQEYYGVNIENAAYPVGTCAERVAISAAITDGCHRIQAVHLLCGTTTEFGSPCGACRQFINEFMDVDGKVFIYNNAGDVHTYTMQDLLPMSFKKKDLLGE